MMKSLSDNKIAIFGTGSVGSYIAHKLACANIDVDLIARGAQLHALNEFGLNVIDANGDNFTHPVMATTHLAGEYDVIFLTVKSKDSLEAALSIKPHLKPNGLIVSLQNGVENPSLISSIINPKNIVSAVIYVTAVLQGYARLKYYNDADISYEYFDTKNDERIDILDVIFSGANIPHKRSKNIKQDAWRKLLFNVVANPLTALFGYTYDKFSLDKTAMKLSHELFDEALVAANIMGADLTSDLYETIVLKCKKNAGFKSSMLQDIESNKKPEIDAILGAVKRVYIAKNLSCPKTEMLLDIMTVKYGSWFQTSPKLTADILVYYDDKILLIDRLNEPLGYAIPGGFVDLNETVEEAAVRELEEETGIKADIEKLEMIGVYSKVDRDNRGRTVSVIYAYHSDDDAVAGDDARTAMYFDISNLPERIAFDHRDAISDFFSEKEKNS